MLHDVWSDKSAVRAVQSMKVVIIVDHFLAKRIQSVTVFRRVSTVDEVPLYSQTSVSVQLTCHVCLLMSAVDFVTFVGSLLSVFHGQQSTLELNLVFLCVFYFLACTFLPYFYHVCAAWLQRTWLNCLRGRLSLRQQVVVAVFGPSQPATWLYHAADCQPTAPVRSVSLVQSAGMPYRII